jgi:hypothetical protein
MRFYHYTFSEVMREDARIFFTMLNESFKIHAKEKIEEMNIQLLPHMKKHDAREMFNNYQKVLIDIEEIIERKFDKITDLKKIL